MINRRYILAALTGLALFVVPAGGVVVPALAAEPVDRVGHAEKFIRSLADEAIEALTKPDTPHETRIANFRKMFNDHFAVRSIGRFVLGRHWRTATDEEKKEYLILFEDLMVVSYVDRFKRYAGENLSVKKARAEKGTTVTVFSEIARPTAKPVQVLWRVGSKGENTKVLDVVVEGASMSQTLRSDFGSIIRQKEGKVAGLLEVLRAKTISLKAEKTN